MNTLLLTLILMGVQVEDNQKRLLSEKQPKKVDLRILLDDKHDSKLLKRELTIDWNGYGKTKMARHFSAMQKDIKDKFNIIFIDWIDGPSRITEYPAIKIGYGNWKSLDKRAFTYQTCPIRTIEWYKDLYFEDEHKEKQKLQHKQEIKEYRRRLRKVHDKIEKKVLRKKAGYFGFVYVYCDKNNRSWQNREVYAFDPEKSWWFKIEQADWRRYREYYRPANYVLSIRCYYLTGKTKHQKIGKWSTYFPEQKNDIFYNDELVTWGLDLKVPYKPPNFVYVRPQPPWEPPRVYPWLLKDLVEILKKNDNPEKPGHLSEIEWYVMKQQAYDLMEQRHERQDQTTEPN